MIPVQSRSSVHPKKMSVQFAGITAWSISGDTAFIATMPTAMDATVITTNCTNSVMTTLNIPPFTA